MTESKATCMEIEIYWLSILQNQTKWKKMKYLVGNTLSMYLLKESSGPSPPWHSYSIIWWRYLSFPGVTFDLYPIIWCFPGSSGSLSIVHQYRVCLAGSKTLLELTCHFSPVFLRCRWSAGLWDSYKWRLLAPVRSAGGNIEYKSVLASTWLSSQVGGSVLLYDQTTLKVSF